MSDEKKQASFQQMAVLLRETLETLASTVAQPSGSDSAASLFPGGVDQLDLEFSLGDNPTFKLRIAGRALPQQESISGAFELFKVYPGNVGLDEDHPDFIAGIVYGETSSMLAGGGQDSQQQMAQARSWIAEIACRRRAQHYQNFPQNLATSQMPDATQMQNPNTKKRWEACKVAQTNGSNAFAAKEATHTGSKQRHFFMWPSNDGKTPRPWQAGEPGSDNWAFHNNNKIIAHFGPFSTGSGAATPAGESIYVFIYEDVA